MNGQLKSFKDLNVWQKSADLAVSVYSATGKFPKLEFYGITNQMRRAIISCSSNIAEGFKRAHKKEKLQFYNVAHGSIAELESQIEIAHKLKFLNKEDYERILSSIIEISKMLGGLIKSLHSQPPINPKFYILDSNTEGQSLIEILIAAAIFVITSAAAIFLFFGGQSLTVDSANSQLALEYASEGLEAARSIQNRDWSQLTDGQHGLVFSGGQWNLSGLSDTRDIFTRIVTIAASSTNPNVKDVKLAVNWQTEAIRPLSVEFNTVMTNWKTPLVGGCVDAALSGNWAAPRVLGSADIGPGNEGTDVAVKLPYVFVSGVASSANKPDLFVFDASNPASPSLVRSLDIGSGGINALFLKDNYLYAASANDSRELAVFNISDPPNTSEAGFLNLSGSKDALSIFGVENVIYLGREEDSGKELFVIDVSNPSLPSIITSFEIIDNVNDLFASSRQLYLVGEESNNDLMVYDIENPRSPILLSSYNLQGGNELISVGLELPANVLAGDSSNKFFVLGATTTSQIYVRDFIDVGGAVNDILCAAGKLVFLATSNTNKEFVIIDISNPGDIKEYASLSFPQKSTGIDFADNKIFMSVRSNDALRIITSQ